MKKQQLFGHLRESLSSRAKEGVLVADAKVARAEAEATAEHLCVAIRKLAAR